MNKPPPYVALSLSAQMHYSREVLFGVFEYVHKAHPWTYITGGIGSVGWKFPVEAKACAALGMFADEAFVRNLMRRNIPVVNVSEKKQGIGTARVLPDNVAAGRMAAEYFIQKKFTNFAYSGCDDFAFSKLRHHGFEEVVRSAGYECFSLNFGHGKWPRDSMDPLPEIGEWLQSLPRPCAVFAHGDDQARRVLNECRRLNILVPDEIAVLGCDNDEIECEFSPTPISSVSFPLRQLGFEAAAMVDLLLEGKTPEFATVRLAPSGIVTRRSTDIVAIQDPTIARAMRFIATNAVKPISVGDDGGDAGLSVVSEAKYGFSCLEGVAGISLVRSVHVTGEDWQHRHLLPGNLRRGGVRPAFSDQGIHHIRLALAPAAAANPAAFAETLFAKAIRYRGSVVSCGFLGIENGDSLVPCWAKPADDGEGWILRLHEALGQRGRFRVRAAPEFSTANSDAMETRRGKGASARNFRPYEILSLRIARRRSAFGAAVASKSPATKSAERI